jgi:hypothetical protein
MEHKQCKSGDDAHITKLQGRETKHTLPVDKVQYFSTERQGQWSLRSSWIFVVICPLVRATFLEIENVMKQCG